MTAELVDAPDLSDEYDAPDDDEGRAAWKVDCLGKANWAMERALTLAMRQQEIRDEASKHIARWEAWEKAQVARFDRDRDFFEDSVAAYALRMRAEDPKRNKTLVTPFGIVKTKESGGSWEVDEAKAIAWAKAYRPEFVRSTETFTLAEAKKVFVVVDGELHDPERGLLVEGITAPPKRITTTVTLDMDAL